MITFNYKDGTETITFDDLKSALDEAKTGSDLDCSTAPRRCGRHIVRSDFFIKKSLLTHSVAAPFRIEPASLGFDSVFFLKPKMSIILLRLFFKSLSALTPLLLLSEKGHARAACSLASALTTALARYQPFSGESRRRVFSYQYITVRRQRKGGGTHHMRSAACFLGFRRRAHPMVTATFITPSRRPSNRA